MCEVCHSLVEVLDALLVGGDAVVGPLRPGEDEVGDLPSAEAHPGGELDLHVVGLLLEGTRSRVSRVGEGGGGRWSGQSRGPQVSITLGRVPKKFRPPSG